MNSKTPLGVGIQLKAQSTKRSKSRKSLAFVYFLAKQKVIKLGFSWFTFLVQVAITNGGTPLVAAALFFFVACTLASKRFMLNVCAGMSETKKNTLTLFG